MNYLYILPVITISLYLSGCGPAAIVNAVGQTVNNAAYNAAERDLNRPYKKSDDEKALEIATANMNVGIEYMRQGDNEKAMIKLKRAIEVKPDLAPAYNVLGLLYQRLGDLNTAENNFKESLSLEPNNSSTKNNYGLFLCSNGRIAEAEKMFLDAADNPLYATPEIALTNAGICTLSEKRDAAEIYFRQALNKDPTFPYALIEMADIAYKKREYGLAHNYFKRYKERNRHTPKSLWLGIRIGSELGLKDDVSSYVLLLRNQYPDTEEAKQMSEWTF